MSRLQILILSAALAGAAPWVAGPLSAQVSTNRAAEFWNNPTFVEKFLGSYGVRSEIEPKVTPEEQKLLRAVIDQIKTDPAAAAAALEKAITPQTSAALDFTLGNLRIQLGDLAGAARSYQAALASNKFPDFMRAHKNLAIVYVQQGQFPEAVQAFTRALELGGEDGNVYGLMGYCFLALEKYLSAEAAYSKALLFAPDNVDWKLGLARCILANQDYRQAISLFEELIQKDPNRVEFWLHQANSYIGMGEPLKAAANYEIVQRMGKADAKVLVTLGDIYMNQDLKELALKSYLASIERDPDQEITRPLRSAEILANRAAWDEASAMLKRIQTSYASKISDEQRLKILKLEARIALATGDQAAAAKTLEQIIARDPLDGEALMLLADHYGRTGQFEKAELLYERAAKLKGFAAPALVQHAQLLVSKAQYSKAVKLLQQAQELNPRDAVARYLEQVQRVARAAQP